MLWWLILLVGVGFIGYLLHAFGKQVDEIEDDAAHIYENRPRDAYGSKFVHILLGRDRR
jgi:hypothetical protein